MFIELVIKEVLQTFDDCRYYLIADMFFVFIENDFYFFSIFLSRSSLRVSVICRKTAC
jgi:hypothetical protein